MLELPDPKFRAKKINTNESLRHCDDGGNFDRIVSGRLVIIESDIESSHGVLIKITALFYARKAKGNGLVRKE